MPWKLLAVSLALLAGPAQAARNVILVIGDGMDDQQVTIARNYLEGSRGRLGLDAMAVRSAVQVLSVDERGSPVYVADSANSATAMATGRVTSRGRISTEAGSNAILPTILQRAQATGMRTGLVTTSSVTDATPAAFASHMSMRTCEDPQAINGTERYGIVTPACPAFLKANGGPGSISEQLAASGVDVILGGGLKHFEQPVEGGDGDVLDSARTAGFRVITSADELANAPGEGRILGLFAPSHLPVKLQGESGRGAEAPLPSWANYLHRYLGSVQQPEPMRCVPNPGFDNTPRLADLTRTALQRLHNERGFFLMVESASIDKQSHERKPCGSIGEVQQLDAAVAVALEYAATNPDTLVIVTADHGHAAQLVPAESLFNAFGIPIYSPGKIARLETNEGVLLAVNYATNNFPYEEHTGVNVPLYANRVALGRVPPMVTQPEVFDIMSKFLFEADQAEETKP